jgi:hypothetical protein
VPSLVDPERVEELIPEPPPPPPAHPLWEGIYSFPLREDNLGVWLFLTLNFTLLAVMATAIRWLLGAGGVLLIGVLLLIPLIGFIGFWAGTYAANCFLAIVEETAAGNVRVAWPKGAGIVDGLGRFLFLVWIAACSCLPGGALSLNTGPVEVGSLPWLVLSVPLWVVCFPVLLLSALTAGLWWKLLDARIVGGLLTRPLALGLMVVPGVVLMAPCFWLAHAIIAHADFLLALAAGPIWAMILLIYGRLLGRVGWMLMDGVARKKPGKKKHRPTGAETRQPAWGEVSDPV